MRNSKGYALLLLVVLFSLAIFIFVGFYLVSSKKNYDLKRNTDNITLNGADKDGGEEDLESELSESDDIKDIETDIEQTIILDEDFSDL